MHVGSDALKTQVRNGSEARRATRRFGKVTLMEFMAGEQVRGLATAHRAQPWARYKAPGWSWWTRTRTC